MTSLLLRRAPARRPALRAPASGVADGRSATLAIILASYLMIIVDLSVIITALPDIRSDLGVSQAGLSWVQNAYTLAFGGLLLLGARAGDLLGRRRVFLAGIGLFTVASLAAGLAQSPAWLLSARVAQGVAAAVVAPAVLALLATTFREGAERARAMALYGAVTGGGGSAGLVIGGLLTDQFSWRWAMFINVPLGVVLLILAPRRLQETARRRGSFDLAGAALSTLGMSALVFGFVRAASDGWTDAVALGSFAAGAALLAAFVLNERRAAEPITPLRLFASRERSGAYAARMLVVGGMFSMFFFVSQYLQGVHGFTPLQAGVAFLPMTLVLFATAQVVPRLTARLGGVPLLFGGLALALAGMTWLSRLTEGTAFVPGIAGPLTLLGLGMGVAFAPLTASGVAGVAGPDAGAASGLVNVSQQLGGSLGLGIMVTIASAAGDGAPTPAAALSDAAGAAVTGSAVFLALALAVVAVVMLRPAARTAPLPAVREGAGSS